LEGAAPSAPVESGHRTPCDGPATERRPFRGAGDRAWLAARRRRRGSPPGLHQDDKRSNW